MNRALSTALASATLTLAACSDPSASSDTNPDAARDVTLDAATDATVTTAEDASSGPAADADAADASGCHTDFDCLAVATPLCHVATGTCVADPNEKDANTPCDAGCGTYQACGYRLAEGCAATTEYCYDNPYAKGAIPGYVTYVCGCDGGAVGFGPASGDLDDLHVHTPIRATESCAKLDAADASDAD